MTSASDAWRPLIEELDAWGTKNLTATFWWRDDDAIEPSAALERMTALSVAHNVPLGLAVIPARATVALAEFLRPHSSVDVLQHGFSHANHARRGERAAEFGRQRSLEVRLQDVRQGSQKLAHFDRTQPIFVPPWNRYDADLAEKLRHHTIRAVSVFGPQRQLPDGIVECNCHCDIISWRTTRGFAGIEKSVSKIVNHLCARRAGAYPASEPTGVLSHHLNHDRGCWDFLDELFRLTTQHPGAQWLRPIEAVTAAFNPSPAFRSP